MPRLVVAVLVTLVGGEVATKFSLRNLSGGPIGVWWREPQQRGRNTRRLIPQTTVSIRNSSSLEVNSYRGHEFIIRRLSYKEPIKELVYAPEQGETLMVMGSTNDIVIVDDELELSRRDGAWALRRVLTSTMASPLATVTDVSERLGAAMDEWREAWLAEEELRLAMEDDVVKLGGAKPKGPIAPPDGWPDRDAAALTKAVAMAVQQCVPNGLPADPAWYASSPASDARVSELLEEWEEACPEHLGPEHRARAFAVAATADGHEWCGRWARVGECNANPNYMRVKCARNCALWEAHDRATLGVDDLLSKVAARDKAMDCLVEELEEESRRLRGAVSAEQNAKSNFAEDLRNRTCKLSNRGVQGPHLGQSHSDFIDRDGRSVKVTPLFAASPAFPASNISLLTGFATPQECRHVMDAAQPRLRPATVNSEDNATAYSMSRRAHAATLDPDFGDPTNLVTKLSRRAFDLANHVTGYNLDPRGQEPFSVIYYNGSKTKEGVIPDEYRPHCDGSCDGSPHLHGGRVATLLLYCAVADEGGATTFTNARTLAAPRPNDAVFFSYFDKDTAQMDTGITQHSGCPVLSGDKWVMTLWMRRGISDADPWSKYDPTGARH